MQQRSRNQIDQELQDQSGLPAQLGHICDTKRAYGTLGRAGLNIRSVETFGPQIDELTFQEGVSLDPPERKEDQEVKDFYREILIVRILELHESDDDSMERLNLDHYNSDDYDEYLSNDMEATPTVITEVKTRP